MSTNEYSGISFDDAGRQAQFEMLLGAVTAATQEREPLSQRHSQAERGLDDGDIDDEQFRSIDDQYIAANNKIAAAKHAVDNFLTQNNDYKAQ